MSGMQKSGAVLEAEDLLGLTCTASPPPANGQRPPASAVAESRVSRLAREEKELRGRARRLECYGDNGAGVLSWSGAKAVIKITFEELKEARKEKKARQLQLGEKGQEGPSTKQPRF